MSSGAAFVPGYRSSRGMDKVPPARLEQLNALACRVCDCGHPRGSHVFFAGCFHPDVLCSCRGFEAEGTARARETVEPGTPARKRGRRGAMAE